MSDRSTHGRARVAFAMIGSAQWTAGSYYLRNLLTAVRSLNHEVDFETILLVPQQATPDSYRDLGPQVDQVIQAPLHQIPGFWQRQMKRVQQRVGFWPDPGSPLKPFLRRHRIACLFAGPDFLERVPMPLLSWIPDFQHLHLPQMFEPEEIRGRNETFSHLASHATRVILSSQHASRDFQHFAPLATTKARVLPFVSQVPENVYDTDPKWICAHYHLPEQFVYLPNQFWRHKNHEVVVEALEIVKTSHPEITVVCTGNTNDYRSPLHFAELLAKLSSLGLRDRMILLGLVPHGHLFQLMRQSLAVLQPSLFEGWSTTVEEAKSIGKQLILSDIAVLREQNPEKATFFGAHDAQQLAGCLVRAFEEKKPGPDYEMEERAREQRPRRTREFGTAFLNITREVLPERS